LFDPHAVSCDLRNPYIPRARDLKVQLPKASAPGAPKGLEELGGVVSQLKDRDEGRLHRCDIDDMAVSSEPRLVKCDCGYGGGVELCAADLIR